MRLRTRWILWILIAGWGRLTSASVLGIDPPPPPIWHPAQELSRDAVFERLDALDERLYEQGFRTAHEKLELAILELCTERPEDRIAALELLEELRRNEPDRLDVLLWLASAHYHARDASSAIAPLEAARKRFEDEAAYHYALGFAYWFDARRHLKPDAVARTIDSFERACELQPTSGIHVLGLASVCLVDEKPERALPYLPKVEAGGRVGLAQLLLTAGLLSFDPDTQETAENLFGQAFRAMPADLASDFESGGGHLPGVPDGDVAAAHRYWNLTDPDPVRSSHRHRLEFWRRHLQADALWGNPEEQVPGWRTETGDAWVRWGRPTFTREFTPSIEPIVSVGGGRGPSGANGGGFRGNMRTWSWTWARPDAVFSMNFVDTSYLRTWQVAPESEETFFGLKREVPLAFPRASLRASFDLAVETALVASTRKLNSIMTSVAIVASDLVPDRRVENLGDIDLRWSLFDDVGERVEGGAFVVDPSSDRDAFLAEIDSEHRASGTRPARALRFGLDVRPGTYRLAMEAENSITGNRKSSQVRVRVRGRPTDSPSMSSLVLGASFDAFDPDDGMPPGFVRYATTLVPHPERTVPRDQDRLYVYFELYDLGLEDDGRTRFGVSYRVTPIGTTDGSPRIDDFVEERTGVSSDGTVVKGTALDLRRLEAGAHELVVTVIDRVRGVRMERWLEFAVEAAPETP